MSRYPQTSNFQDAKRSGQKPKLNREHLGFIDRKMKENDELNFWGIKRKIIEGVWCGSVGNNYPSYQTQRTWLEEQKCSLLPVCPRT